MDMQRVSTAINKDFSELLSSVHEIGNDIIKPAANRVDADARFPREAFDALKENQLLSCYVPSSFGGMDLDIREVCRICEALGAYCASTAMIFAMHQIQVACIVHHRGDSVFFAEYLQQLVKNQYLLASATTELGVGGDLRTSLTSVNVNGDQFTLDKQAPVISYGEAADAILVTCRRAADAPAADQVQVLVKKSDCTLEPFTTWDTLGFRGTCSLGFKLKSRGNAEQIQPAPFADILAQSMHPVSHLVWGSLWLGIAQNAVDIARSTVRAAARKTPDALPISAMRLTEVDEVLFGMRAGLYVVIDEYQESLVAGDMSVCSEFGTSIRINNVKLRCSELVVEVVSKALVIVGISGYKNDSSSSLSRHLRDAFGASIMVNNDRIRNHNSTMQIMVR